MPAGGQAELPRLPALWSRTPPRRSDTPIRYRERNPVAVAVHRPDQALSADRVRAGATWDKTHVWATGEKVAGPSGRGSRGRTQPVRAILTLLPLATQGS